MTGDKESQTFVRQQLTWGQKRESLSIESRHHLQEIHVARGTEETRADQEISHEQGREKIRGRMAADLKGRSP